MIMQNKVLIHTVEQPESDITTFVLSCNRLDVLDKTLYSFYATKDYTTKMVIVDDSAEPGVFETLVERYGKDCDVICFPKNRTQWWAMDFMVSYCDTEYIFYLEDDWEFLQSGYIQKSKEILQKYRNIGTVDISWRTFEDEGFECYEKELIDDAFYWKKPWKISDYHLHWYGWIGSPNLKRRDDLILLGRVEKWHNEWNIDRRFLALGFKAVFLNGQYVVHLGDHCSRMEGRRPNDGTTPENYYPSELLKDRIWPKLDYLFLDKHWKFANEVTMVTTMVDIQREDRDFQHYLDGMKSVLKCRNPMIVYAPQRFHDFIKKERGTLPLTLYDFDTADIEKEFYFDQVQKLITKDEWIQQSEWMKDSVIKSKYYIPLTLVKPYMLRDVARNNIYGSKRFYWIDAGMCSSFGITEHIDMFNFLKIPDDGIFMTSYPYETNSEIHGFNINVLSDMAGAKPNKVCRATLFGGNKTDIEKFTNIYTENIINSLKNGAIGTEEAIFTMMSIRNPELIYRYDMPNGDIRNYLNTIRSR